MNDEKLEGILRKSPLPVPPSDLLNDLKSDIYLPPASRNASASPNAASWVRRWFPAIGIALIFLSCVIVLAIQTDTVVRKNGLLKEALDAREASQAGSATTAESDLERLRKDNRELHDLKIEAERLRGDLSGLPSLEAENKQLAANMQGAGGKETDEQFFARAVKGNVQAERINCVNNLKQIVLAARICAIDDALVRDEIAVRNGAAPKLRAPGHSLATDQLPSTFGEMLRALNTLSTLICPSDKAHTAASSLASWTPENCSYQILSPGVLELNVAVVYAYCPIHNNCGLVDGSVHQLAPDRKPVMKDNKWVLP